MSSLHSCFLLRQSTVLQLPLAFSTFFHLSDQDGNSILEQCGNFHLRVFLYHTHTHKHTPFQLSSFFLCPFQFSSKYFGKIYLIFLIFYPFIFFYSLLLRPNISPLSPLCVTIALTVPKKHLNINKTGTNKVQSETGILRNKMSIF